MRIMPGYVYSHYLRPEAKYIKELFLRYGAAEGEGEGFFVTRTSMACADRALCNEERRVNDILSLYIVSVLNSPSDVVLFFFLLLTFSCITKNINPVFSFHYYVYQCA